MLLTKVYSFDLFIFNRMSVVEKEDWRGVIDLVTNAKQVVYSVQDVARRLADYAKFRRNEDSSGEPPCIILNVVNISVRTSDFSCDQTLLT